MSLELAYLLLGCGALFVIAWRLGLAVPVWAAVLIALAVRLAAAVLGRGYTPEDVAVCFRDAGNLVLAGRDPLTQLPRFEWNFLPLMPYVFAAELRTGLPWPLAAKIAPIAADLVTTVLLGWLRPGRAAGGAQAGPVGSAPGRQAGSAPGRQAGSAPLLYAVCPVAILVSAVHGQVEPVALALGIAALLLARRGAVMGGAVTGGGVVGGVVVGSGLLAGLAVATKTWPVLLVLGVLRETPVRRWWRLLVPLAAVLLGMLLSVRLFLHDSLRGALDVLVSYRSVIGWWGWTGILHLFDLAGSGFTGPGVDAFQRIGTVAVIAAIGGVLLLRWADGVALTAAVLLAFLAVTAGFGPQYLLWPVPLLLVLRWSWGLVFATLASGYAGFVYLVALPHPEVAWLAGLERWASLPVILSALLAVLEGAWRTGTPIARRRSPADRYPPPHRHRQTIPAGASPAPAHRIPRR